MTDDSIPSTPLPDDDGPDPADAELIAYLDGELDDATAADVERRMAADPQLRARAAALKKSFDLLDFLPRPDPSPTFATRTLDRLPAVRSSIEAKPVAAPASPSSSVPIVLSTGPLALSSAGRPWAWVVGVAVAVGLAVGVGYLGTALARSYFRPPPKDHPVASPTPVPDDDPPPDRVIEFLPLYAAADNLEFVRELVADPELFGEEAVGLGGVPAAPRVPWVGDLTALAKAFKALPTERQKQIRLLDQQIHQLDPAERVPLIRALEAYAAWLDRLPDPADRRTVLAATGAKDRLEEVLELRRKQWVAGLPAAQQKKLQGLPAAERAALMATWRDEEAERRRAWALPGPTREAIRQGKPPWPFDNDELKKQVIDYARAVYRIRDRDDKPDDKDRGRPRLPQPEQLALQERYDLGRDENAWFWFGKMLYDLSGRLEVFPEPRDGKPLTDFAQLPDPVRQFYLSRPALHKKLEPRHAGRWPEFALAVHEDLTLVKGAPSPAAVAFGPARPDEFRDPTRLFITRDLLPALRPADRFALAMLEGRWPEYPRLVTQHARHRDLSVPGAMLPGRPSDWERTYGGGGRPAGRRTE
jgi:hypothetical protein